MDEILFCEFDLNDHGFATDGLIEIRILLVLHNGDNIDGAAVSNRWANRQVTLVGCRQMLWFRCRPRRETLRRCIEFIQMPFHRAGRDSASGQKPVEFRMR